MGQLVVVGGGLSSARVVSRYREEGGDDAILLITADTFPPYHRPPLSKRFLRGEAGIADTLVQPEEWYAEHGVELRERTRVARARAGHVELEDGKTVAFDRLVLATGGRPRRPTVPGAELEGVRLLRTLDDSQAIRALADQSERAVVIGASFIGSEVAASLRTLGLDVTLVHRGTGIFDALRVPELSASLARLYEERGVTLVFGDEVEAFEGNGSVERVRTKGGRELDADLVVAGIGIDLNLELLDGSGVEVDNGVVVDARFESSVPGIYAVGDIVNFHDPVAGRRRRIEHWSHANYTGGELGAILAGARGGFDTVASFFSEVFGLSFRVFGDPEVADGVVVRGSFDDADAVAFYRREDLVVGALTVGASDERIEELKEQIRRRAPVATV